MENTLIVTAGAHQRAYPIGPQTRVRTNCGVGNLVYATEDGWLGVQLDGETRVDEYFAEHCTRLDLESGERPALAA